jgi:hypothetical protein
VDASSFTLKGEGATVIVYVERYEIAQADCGSDSDWLEGEVHLQIAPFRAQTRCSVMAAELETFFRDLAALVEALAGTAEFKSDQDILSLSATMQRTGRARVKGRLSTHGLVESELSFAFETDQSYLRHTLSDLAVMTRRFPSRS